MPPPAPVTTTARSRSRIRAGASAAARSWPSPWPLLASRSARPGRPPPAFGRAWPRLRRRAPLLRVPLVAAADVAPHDGAGLDNADPRVEVPAQFRVAVVAVGHEGAQRGRILPGLEDEDTVGIGGVEGDLARHRHHHVSPRELCHPASRADADLNVAMGGRRLLPPPKAPQAGPLRCAASGEAR